MKINLILFSALCFPLSLGALEQDKNEEPNRVVDPKGIAYFDQHIHPILEKKCFSCHGTEKVEGGLVLTNRDGLLKGGTRGSSINIQKPADSVLLKMINNDDLKQRMPFQQPPLSAEEKEAITQWLAMGAPYNPDREMQSEVKHDGPMVIDDEARSYWAYQPPQKPEVPQLQDASIKNAIDAFIAEELNKKGINPNARAEAKHLLRRLYFDLRGLAPSLETLDAFAKAPQNQEEWKKRVTELLASPHFGERMAILWLDLVRYAETNSFERDSEKPYIWRYRDYVITAFNSNMPYDRFITEQLAGDEVENANRDSRIATGFLALMQRDDEPADGPQAHADMIGEMVDVTSEAFLASTLGCAKCHDHKGDPIRQRDYYSMMAFFDPIAQTQLKHVQHYWKDPAHQAQLEAKLKQSQGRMKQLWATVDVTKLDPLIKKPGNASPPIIPLSEDKSRQEWLYSYTHPKDLNWNQPSYGGSEFKPVKLPMRAGRASGHFTGHAEAWEAHKPELYLRKDFALTNIPERVVFYSLANSEALTVFINGVQIFKGKPHQAGRYQFYPLSAKDVGALTTGKNTIGLVVENKNRTQKFFNIGLFTSPITTIAPQHYAGLFPKRIEGLYGKPFLDKFLPLNNEVNSDRARANDKGLPYMSQKEQEHVGVPKIHIRGNVHASGQDVPLAVPAVMVSSDDKAELPIRGNFKKNGTHGRRLALAKWISSKENPLTARVMVNRLWQHCFGVGIVPSSNDFGTLGEDPTNQKLLDWLATEFMDSGWDIKHMLSLMLSSDTYQRSTAPSEVAMKTDPNNTLHWRHSPRRLSAEEIRDSFLAVTGELQLQKPKLPFVRPEMPPAVLATSSKPHGVWPPTHGPEANSRSVYVHVKRSIQLPMFSSFDAPERDMSCAARFATTVPTQALTMLNSKFVNDRARKFAERISAQHPESIDLQMRYGFELATGRPAKDEESGEFQQLFQALTTEYKLSSKDALDRVCLLILNLNETIYLD